MYCCLMNRQIILPMPPPPILSACCPRGADHCSSLATTAHSLMRSSHHCSISTPRRSRTPSQARWFKMAQAPPSGPPRSEEHTSELQSRFDLVCRLLLEKKKRTNTT